MATSSALLLADLALTWDIDTGDGDLSMIDSDIASDAGLVTACLLSLFLDARADVDDQPPSNDPNDRRGWWADEFSDFEGDRIGSRLWLLDRSVLTRDTAQRAELYVREGLAWLLQDRVAESIGVVTEATGERLNIDVELARPGRDPVKFRFSRVWDHTP